MRSRMSDAPPVGKEPFGLFAFRAPEGMLWRKWRGIEADIAKEHTSSIAAEPMPKAARPTPRSFCG